MIYPIVIYGHPVLRKESIDFDPTQYPELKQLISDMFDTLTESEGVGLAAPQIGKNIRLAVIDLSVLADELPEYTDFKRAYINPHIVETDPDAPEETMEEGCLSLPGIHEKVTRPTRIHVTFLDEDYQPHDEWVDGYLARVMQHEFDHLDAHLFIDRITPLRKQLIKNKLRAIQQGRFRCGYKVKLAPKH